MQPVVVLEKRLASRPPVIFFSRVEHAFPGGEIRIGNTRVPAESVEDGSVDVENVGGFGERENPQSAIKDAFFQEFGDKGFSFLLRKPAVPVESSVAAHGRKRLRVADEEVGQITGPGLQARRGDKSGVNGRTVRYGGHFDDNATLPAHCAVEALNEIVHGRFGLGPVNMPHGQGNRILP